MVQLGPGLVVLIRFPFSDLSSSKLRPAVVLAHAGGGDWVLCQVTSNPYGDPTALPLVGESFASGGLPRDSFARPGKLFTASEEIVVRVAGSLTSEAHHRVVDGVVRLIQSGVKRASRPTTG
jgi:mRNA interferase MazF